MTKPARYFSDNLGQSFLVSPTKAPAKTWALVPVFVFIALSVGFSAGLFQPGWLDSPITPLLPFILFVFPSLLEEAFFRGVLIPRNILESGRIKAFWRVVISTLVFVAWHPLNALAFNPTAIPLFLDPWFLVIVAAMGLTCGHAYVLSRSIWVPVIIHWAAVTVWVLFLGGRNLVLEL
ncbi:CAAX protease self-immunity [Marinobacter sp. es.048]|uniref:CPBP family glutamic-type intramembrane protease n=1 Tax=Marinobacter sp. es.048 TaxID=1761795 RepID=UPI000B588D24|nr:CPBP family glutamic-type intramembrane protease [Marinobacter sp. es.048]SNC75109.1 CAAX protease self-immunity [Marinobacter sp. es.048]